MRRPSINRWALALAIAGLVLSTPAAYGAGFGIFEQGSKAMGMAGAFTAQADDGSAMFHNVGGLAFQTEQSWDAAAGLTYIRGLTAEFEGADPFPGAGYTAEQETLSEFPPHFYYVRPLSDTWVFGLGGFAPFGLTTEWEDDFRGRFISRLASLQTLDINPSLGWKVSDNFGFGFGATARFSTVELERHVPQINPFTNTVADIATLRLEGELTDNVGYGFNLGMLHKVNNSFSWGLSYRSKIEVDYEGEGRVTQNLTGTPFDGLVAGLLPFGSTLPVETAIDFPDQASLGLAFALGPNSLLETDVNWTGWSSFDQLQVIFPGGELPNLAIPEEYDDAFNYRVGLAYDTSPGTQWRFGVVFDESPQPEGAVSPLLPDSDRVGVTLGYGRSGPGIDWDVAVMYLDFDERTRDENFPGDEASTFFGTYNQEALLVGLTLSR